MNPIKCGVATTSLTPIDANAIMTQDLYLPNLRFGMVSNTRIVAICGDCGFDIGDRDVAHSAEGWRTRYPKGVAR